jgi:microcystin-dependent protein
MSTPYVGEIRLLSFPFAPVGWMSCNGQLLPVSLQI